MTGKTDAIYTCPAVGCKRAIMPEIILCWDHWNMVPLALQVGISLPLITEEERTKLIREAILAVATHEGSLKEI